MSGVYAKASGCGTGTGLDHLARRRKETVVFPGFDGGAEWGGSAFDPESGVLYVNANDVAWTGSLALRGAPSPGVQKYRFTGYRKWLDPDGYPAVAPPWARSTPST